MPRPRSTRSATGCARDSRGARVLGVGHRVVHGGAQYTAPTIVTPQVLDDLRALVPLAPLHQPHNLAGDRGRRRAVCPTCRRWRASTRASIAASRRSPSSCRCRRRSAMRACSATASTGCRTSTSRRSCPRSAPEIADGRVIVAHLGSGASLCALKNAQERRQHARLHARSTGSAWARGPARSIPGVVLYLLPDARAVGQGRRDDALQEVRAARHLRHQQRHARPAREHASRRRASRSTTSSIARRRRSARSRPCSAASTGWCSRPASASTRPRSAARICEASAWLGIELDASSEREARPAHLDGRAAACRRG